MSAQQTKFLNVNRVWDFATQTWSKVIEIDNSDGQFFFLDSNVPLTLEYPTRWRSRSEIGNSWGDPHGLIFAPDTLLRRN